MPEHDIANFILLLLALLFSVCIIYKILDMIQARGEQKRNIERIRIELELAERKGFFKEGEDHNGDENNTQGR